MVMKNKINKQQEIVHTLLEIMEKSTAAGKKAMHFGTNSLLHPSEIHMIASIAESQDPHIIGLAKELGVTKGAVSQIVKKLERKGTIKRNIDTNNRSKYLLELTPKGLLAYKEHIKFHQSVDSAFLHIFEKLPDDRIEQVLQIFREINNEIEKFF